MYHHHFGLNGPPFHLTPAPEALYLSQTHREALAALEWGLLQEPTGFTLLVGESGVGKSILLGSVLARRYRNVRVAIVTNPRLDFHQLMQVVMSQLAPGCSGQTALELNQGFVELLDDLAAGERVAIIIDEAQDLSDDALEGLLLLSSAATIAERRLQIIFVGRPDIIDRLARPAMHCLNQRIGSRTILKPLGPTEVHEYIDCRLRAKGGSAEKIFAPAALSYLAAHSGGIPHLVNVLSHNSMLRGYAAASRRVSLAMVKSVVSEYEDSLSAKQSRTAGDTGAAPALEPQARRRLTQAALAVTAIALAMVGAIFLLSRSWFYRPPTVLGGTATRPISEPYMIGPAIPPRPAVPIKERRALQDARNLVGAATVLRERQ